MVTTHQVLNNWSSCPKVIWRNVISPKTRVVSPISFGYVTQRNSDLQDQTYGL